MGDDAKPSVSCGNHTTAVGQPAITDRRCPLCWAATLDHERARREEAETRANRDAGAFVAATDRLIAERDALRARLERVRAAAERQRDFYIDFRQARGTNVLSAVQVANAGLAVSTAILDVINTNNEATAWLRARDREVAERAVRVALVEATAPDVTDAPALLVARVLTRLGLTEEESGDG